MLSLWAWIFAFARQINHTLRFNFFLLLEGERERGSSDGQCSLLA